MLLKHAEAVFIGDDYDNILNNPEEMGKMDRFIIS